MNILFVNRYMGEAGGVEHYINALARRLSEAGHRAGIVHWDDTPERPGFRASYRIPAVWDKELSLEEEVRGRIDGALGDFSPDVIYLHNMENGRVMDYLRSRARVVRYVHGYKTVDPDGKMLLRDPVEPNNYPLTPACFLRAYTRKNMPRDPVKAFRAYTRARSALEATKRIERVLVASEHMRKTLIDNGVSPGKITPAPYFVDYEGAGETCDPLPGRILFAGRIAEGKGLDVLIDVLAPVKEDFIMDVVGDGPLESFCRDKAEKAGLAEKVKFHGWKEHSTLPEYYGKCMFIIMPSVWPEPFGICGIEAAFFGKPCVAFDVGGISDWLTDGETGFLVEPYSREAMGQKITELLGTPGKAAAMGRRAGEIVREKFDPETHLKKILPLLQKI